MRFLLLFVVFLATVAIHAQSVQSVQIIGMDFKYRVPDNWKQVSKDTGVSLTETTNCEFEMPPSEPGCGGSLIFSLSEVTGSEKERRKAADNDTVSRPDSIVTEVYSLRTIFKYQTACGHFGTAAGTSYVNAKTGRPTSEPVTKRQKKITYMVDYVNYASWIYFPINDTLEILISFHGRIPEYAKDDMDKAVSRFGDYFFLTNDTLIDSLLAITDPFRFEPKALPLDSVKFLNTHFKYPVLPGWTYDTTRTSTEIKTSFLNLKCNDNTECSNASISLTYRVTPYDAEAKQKEEIVMIPWWVIIEELKNPKPKPKAQKQENLTDSARKEQRDSSFAAWEQHYFFSSNTNQEPGTACNGKEVVTRTVCVFVFTKPDERIKIAVTFSYMADQYGEEIKYRHEFYRFITQMADGNDFEQFYLNNKK